jgi:predicted hotdog family 3-hydroxylacyl-ACP dehydratase
MNDQCKIEDYIPQRPPFVFIDTIEEINEHIARTRYTIPKESPLVTNDILPLAGLMENAAQTCATRAGNKIGYIGAIKQMEVTSFPHVGQTLTTEAMVIHEVLNISLMEIKTYLEGKQIATTVLKIATME